MHLVLFQVKQSASLLTQRYEMHASQWLRWHDNNDILRRASSWLRLSILYVVRVSVD